jgi:hypothetical protein
VSDNGRGYLSPVNRSVYNPSGQPTVDHASRKRAPVRGIPRPLVRLRLFASPGRTLGVASTFAVPGIESVTVGVMLHHPKAGGLAGHD